MSTTKLEDIILTEFKPEFIIPSGSLLLDKSDALKSFKGIPSGSVVHLFSPQEGSFKSSLAMQGLANVQKLGHKVGFVDAECALMDTSWVESLGIDTSNNWGMVMPETGEEACDITEKMLEAGYKGIVVDSIDAIVPEKQLTSEYGDADIGMHAKLITRFMRRLRYLVVKHNAIVWLVNQEKINMTAMGARGHKPTGGSGIMFYSKLNIEMKREKSESQLEGQDIIELLLNVKRSKFGSSYVKVHTYARQGKGIDKSLELIEMAREGGLIKRNGSWWKQADGTAIGQTLESVGAWCEENKEFICA
jgi:recombination protein RecA